MKTATVRIKTENFGNEIIRKGVTPAELMFLVATYHRNVGGDPVVSLEPEFKKVPGQIHDRDASGKPIFDGNKARMVEGLVDSEEPNEVSIVVDKKTGEKTGEDTLGEIRRLAQHYGGKRIKGFYQGAFPQLPTTFEEARIGGTQMTIEGERLLVAE